MIKISVKELFITWICLSIGTVFINYLDKDVSMSLHEIIAAIYFMGMYMAVVYANGLITYINTILKDKKDAGQPKKTDIKKKLDLVPIPNHMMPGAPDMYPGIKIYRNYQLPKLDSEDLFETYEKIMLVHPGAAIEKGDMIKREDLELANYKGD